MSGRGFWLLGLVTGVLLGLVLALGAFIGLALGFAALVGGLRSRRHLAYVPGLFVGIGATWLVLLARIAWGCARFPGSDRICVVLDLTPWLAISALVTALGIVLTGLAIRPVT